MRKWGRKLIVAEVNVAANALQKVLFWNEKSWLFQVLKEIMQSQDRKKEAASTQALRNAVND